ncbi:MAG: AI-2E family transporter [Cyanobacteria bacterium J06648_11]
MVIAASATIVIAGLSQAGYVAAPLAAGLVFGIVLGPIAKQLKRFGVSPVFSSLIFVAAFISGIAALFYFIAQPLEEWSTRIPEIGDKFSREWAELQRPIEQLKQVEQKVDNVAVAVTPGQPSNPIEVVVKRQGIVTDLLNSAPDVIARVIIFFVSIYFFIATYTRTVRLFVSAFPQRASQMNAARRIRGAERALSRYVFTISLINVGLGLCVAVAMYAVGLPEPLLWGVLATIANFVPYLGMIAMTIVIGGVGLISFDQLPVALLPAALFLLINGIEGQFVTPLLLGRSLTLNPLAVFASSVFLLWLWGPLGAFLAVPLLILLVLGLERDITSRLVRTPHGSS